MPSILRCVQVFHQRLQFHECAIRNQFRLANVWGLDLVFIFVVKIRALTEVIVNIGEFLLVTI